MIQGCVVVRLEMRKVRLHTLSHMPRVVEMLYHRLLSAHKLLHPCMPVCDDGLDVNVEVLLQQLQAFLKPRFLHSLAVSSFWAVALHENTIQHFTNTPFAVAQVVEPIVPSP